MNFADEKYKDGDDWEAHDSYEFRKAINERDTRCQPPHTHWLEMR